MNVVNTVNSANRLSSKYRFELDRSSKKFTCPQCRQKRFVLYRDLESGEYLPEEVGRCDREHQCGHHYTPKQFLEVKGEPLNWKLSPEPKPEEQKTIDFLPMHYLEAGTNPKLYRLNNFFLFLTALFGEQVARFLFGEYLIGTSNYWRGAAFFPQIDIEGKLRQLKLMLHDPVTGKRVKEGATVDRYDRKARMYVRETTDKHCSLIYGRYINEGTRHLNLEQTFFGCHLVAEYPHKKVCVVESEKTAVIASVFLPQFVWIATGGASGCRWRDYKTYKVFAGRDVTFFPDHGFFNKQKEVTCYQEWQSRIERIKESLNNPRIRVSDLLERRLQNSERTDQDLADLLIARDVSTGLALTDDGYPAFWDYKTK